MQQDPNFDQLKAQAPKNDLKYVEEFLPGYRGGVVGNGVHRYAPNLAKGDLAAGAEVFENLVADEGGLRVQNAARRASRWSR